MRIISYNVNGVRSAMNKGFVDWLKTDPADVVCLQEIKADQADIDVAALEALGFHTYWCPAQKKGYSGVGILTKRKPDHVEYGCHLEQSDYEGRVIRADFGDTTLINAYFPSGTMGDLRQTYKYQWLDEFLGYLEGLRKKRSRLVICGDYNIAHREIDIHNPKGNHKTSGFLPEERAWMDKFISHGYVDTFRFIHPERTGSYSWWSQRFPSVRESNKGWRIDYITVTDAVKDHIKDADILPHIKHSDHCPIYADIQLS